MLYLFVFSVSRFAAVFFYFFSSLPQVSGQQASPAEPPAAGSLPLERAAFCGGGRGLWPVVPAQRDAARG